MDKWGLSYTVWVAGLPGGPLSPVKMRRTPRPLSLNECLNPSLQQPTHALLFEYN